MSIKKFFKQAVDQFFLENSDCLCLNLWKSCSTRHMVDLRWFSGVHGCLKK